MYKNILQSLTNNCLVCHFPCMHSISTHYNVHVYSKQHTTNSSFASFLQTMGITIQLWRARIGQHVVSGDNNDSPSIYTQLHHAVYLQFLTLLEHFKTCWKLEALRHALGLNCSFISEFEAVPLFTIKQLQKCHTSYPAILMRILLLKAGVESNPGPWTPPTQNMLMPVVNPWNMCFHISICQMLRYFFKRCTFTFTDDQESFWLQTMFHTDDQIVFVDCPLSLCSLV